VDVRRGHVAVVDLLIAYLDTACLGEFDQVRVIAELDSGTGQETGIVPFLAHLVVGRPYVKLMVKLSMRRRETTLEVRSLGECDDVGL
jgi:hypothetical protein